MADPIPVNDLKIVKENFEQLLRLLHPFMPFLTEKLWQDMNGNADTFINQSQWPETNEHKTDASVELSRDLISLVRSVRNGKNISPKIAAQLSIKTTNETMF